MTDLVDRLFVISVSNRFSFEISSKLASSPFNHPTFISIFHRACRIGRARYSVLTLSEEAKHIESRRLFSRSDTSPAESKKFPLPKNRWDVRSKLNRTKIELYFSIPIIFVFRELWSFPFGAVIPSDWANDFSRTNSGRDQPMPHSGK